MDHQRRSQEDQLAAERARRQAEIEQLRRDMETLRRQRELERRARVEATSSTSYRTTTSSADPGPLRVVIGPDATTRVAAGR